MNIIDVKQGTTEWIMARLGVPTASCFDQILTAKKLEPSASQAKYLARLCAEWFIGEPIDDGSGSGFTDRGTGMEEEAARWYSFDTGSSVESAGFCLHDDHIAGCSPDRFVEADGLLEIKCPAAHTHMNYYLNGFEDAYTLQVQGQLWVTGRKWLDKLSYHPVIPCVTLRVQRDEKIIAAIDREVRAFAEKLDAARKRLESFRPAPKVFTEEADSIDMPF